MKIAALDLGDVWVGIAISDMLGIIAKPYETIKNTVLKSYLAEFIKKEKISIIVIGHPRTLRGTSSEQTKKVEAVFAELKTLFPATTFTLWDERLTSKQAASIKSTKTSEDKRKSHAIAAALILQTYLRSRSSTDTDTDTNY